MPGRQQRGGGVGAGSDDKRESEAFSAEDPCGQRHAGARGAGLERGGGAETEARLGRALGATGSREPGGAAALGLSSLPAEWTQK